MEVFRPTRDGGASVRLDAGEASLLRSLIGQVMDLIVTARPENGQPGGRLAGSDSAADLAELEILLAQDQPMDAPEDPILARLLPDGYRDDPGAASEFRRYTEPSLRETKQASAQTLLDTLPAKGGKIRLSGDQARAWLRALNDVRLAFGVRLEVTEDFEEQLAALDPEDPKVAAFEVYGWLGAVQASLVDALA
jgi:Domain of unknown function (DUF2017)